MTRDTYRGVVLGLIAGLLLAALLVVTVRASAPRSAQYAGFTPFVGTPAIDVRDWADRGAVVPRRPTLSPSPSTGTRPATKEAAAGRNPPAASSLRGIASWFAAPTGTAAAGPTLRAALGPSWRGMVIRVCGISTCIRVVLDDWCACRGRVIDLSAGSFSRLAPLSAGLTVVTVSRP